MGNYARTERRIEELKESLAKAKEVGDLEAAYEIEISIGECEGYLEELAEMDGYDNYSEYLEESGQYFF